MKNEDFNSDHKPLSPEGLLAIMVVLGGDWEGGANNDIDHQLLNHCQYLQDRVEWLENQLKLATEDIK